MQHVRIYDGRVCLRKTSEAKMVGVCLCHAQLRLPIHQPLSFLKMVWISCQCLIYLLDLIISGILIISNYNISCGVPSTFFGAVRTWMRFRWSLHRHLVRRKITREASLGANRTIASACPTCTDWAQFCRCFASVLPGLFRSVVMFCRH